MLIAHIVGAEKNGSPEDARMVGVWRVGGLTIFLVERIALVHALFNPTMIFPPRTEPCFCLYEKLQRLRK